MSLAYGMKTIKIICGIFLIFCIGFLIATLYLGYRHYDIINNWQEVSATVVYVNSDDESFRVTYYACFSDGIPTLISNDISHFYSSSINVGDLLIAYYNPESVYDIYFMQEISLPIIFGVISIIFLIVTLVIYFVNLYKDITNKKCKENGKRVKLQVTRAIDTSAKFNGKSIYRLAVMYKNKEYISQAYYFKDKFIEVSNHKIVDLYLLDNKYYIDLESFRSGDIFDDRFII